MRLKFYLFLFTSLLSAGSVYSIDYYWIGGSGEWKDPKHWALSDGGSIGNKVPSEVDNVFFTSQSFTSKKNNVVQIDDGINCNSIDFSAITDQVTISGNEFSYLGINGSLILSEKLSFSSIHSIVLNSSGNENFIDSKSLILNTNIFFTGTGKWKLLSDIYTLDNNTITFLNGEIVYNTFRINALDDRTGIEKGIDNCAFFDTTSTITQTNCNNSCDGVAIVVASAGTGPYFYQWTGPLGVIVSGINQTTISNRCNNVYTLVITDLGVVPNKTCFFFPVISEPPPLALIGLLSETPPTCFGLCDGTADPLVVGGNVGNYTYLWSSGETTTSASMLCDPFHLKVTDSKGCVLDTTYKYPNAPLPITFNGSTKTDILCNGGNTGAINLQINGGTPGFNEVWTSTLPPGFSSTNEDISGLTANIYHVSVTDANNCPKDTSFTIMQFPPININFTKANNVCAVGNIGSININVSGGNPIPTYSYSWNLNGSFFSNSEDLSNLLSGSYELTVTDGSSCQKIITIIITEPPAVSIAANITNVLCFAGNTGSIDLTFSGGVNPLSVSWIGLDYLNSPFSANSQDIFNLKAGVYTATIIDGNNCMKDTSFNITQPDEIVIFDTVFNVSCFGANNGSIDLTINGGVPNYNILWDGPGTYTSTNEDIIDLIAGNYLVTVTDFNSCVKTGSYSIVEPTQINIIQSIQNVNCNGDSTGSISVVVNGGTPLPISPFYTFNWTNVTNSSLVNQTNLPAGNYSVTVTDLNNCSVTENYLISQLPAIILDLSVTNNICSYDSLGSINLTPSGGQIPYSYNWTPNILGFQNQDIFNLGNGTYSVEVTDNLGCKETGTADITSNLPILSIPTIVDVSCNGGSNGSISLVISGGNPNFQINWIKIGSAFSATGISISNLTAGFYIYNITDASNCVLIDTAEVTQPLPLILDAIVTSPFCNNVNDGNIILQISQGTDPYTILWTSGIVSNNDTITNLAGGSYSVLITDSEGCTISDTYTLLEQEEITIASDIVNIQCNGLASGSIDLSITGGLSPYSILWTGPSINSANETLEDIANLMAGTYNLSVMDSVGCSSIEQYIVDEATPIELSYTKTDIICFGGNTGFIDLTITGGSDPYDFEWLAPIVLGNNEDQAGLIAGLYTITVIDNDFCSIDTTIELTQNTAIQISTNIINTQCSGISSGSISISVSGGISGYTFEWAGPSINAGNFQDEDLTNLATGNYLLIITDAVGCEKDTSFFVGQNDPITASFNVTDILCNGFSTGAIDATVTSTNTINLLSWSDTGGLISNTEDISGLSAGDYYFLATDDVGCNYKDTITIGEPNKINLNPVISNIDCFDNNNGIISTNISGGTPDFEFNWSGGNITTLNDNDQNLSGLIAAVYTLNVLDSNNCNFDTTITITEPTQLLVNISVTDILCNGQTASIAGNVSGGTSPFIIKWTDASNNTIANTISVINLIPGIYSLLVIDSSGCSLDTSITITQPDSIAASYNITNSHCLLSDGEIIAIGTGGVEPYNYLWQNTNGDSLSITNVISGIPAGIYSFTILDTNNCIFNQLVALSDTGAIINAVKTNLTCYETPNGAIDISIIGGTSPYAYFWNGPSINSTILNNENLEDIDQLLAGDYNVTITDSNGCIFTNVTNLQQPDSISINANINNVTCFGDGDASIDIVISGGTPNYTSTWTSLNGNGFVLNSNGEDISALSPDIYTVSVEDNNNCINTSSFSITQNDPLSVSAILIAISCHNENNGVIDIVPIGGTPPYQFSWTGSINSTDQSINNLAAGQYNLLVTDSNNCSFDTLFVIDNPSPIVISTVITNSNCLQSNGGIATTVIGGTITSDYIYTWIDSDNNVISDQPNLINVPAGVYQLEVKDDNDCSSIATVAISDSNGSIDATISPVNCIDPASGAIDVTVNGAVGTITYLWANPIDSISNIEDINNLLIGSYSITATDSIGCVFTDVYILEAPTPINATAIVTNLNCFDDESGAIDITVTGGLEPFEIRWNGSLLPSDQQDLMNLDAGDYDLNITDDLGCVYEDTYSVLQNPLLSAALIVTQPNCLIDTLGSVSGSFQGGIGPFTINWSGPDGFAASQINISDLVEGDYCLNITDSLGCNFDTCITISALSSIILVLDTIIQPLCNGSADGAIEISVSGTIGLVSYTWLFGTDTIASSEDLLDQPAGIYTLIVSDESGCDKTNSFQLNNKDSITIQPDITNALCYGSESGAIDLNVLGGTPEYNFIWTLDEVVIEGDSTLEGITSGDYIIIITDANNCQLNDTISIAELTTFDISEVTVIDAQCSNDSTGAISIVTLGGTEDFSYNWTGEEYSSDQQNIINVLPGEYTITVTDANNCVADSTIEIGYLFEIASNAGLDTSLCPENLPLFLIGTGINQTENAWYNLEGILLSNDSTLIYNNTFNTSDTLVYIASNGSCSSSDTIVINVFDFAIADAGLDQTIFGDQEFTLGGNPSGVNAISYLWEPTLLGLLDSTASNPTTTILESTLFTLTIIDENGCINKDSTFITRIPTIIFYNGITPNGDGKNDDWTIGNIELFPNNQVEVYNRWGDILFQQSPYDNSKPWTGKYEGKDLPVGTYYYIINLNDPQFPDAFTGPITILR